MSMEKLTYTIREAAELLGISRNLAYALAKREKLPGLIRLGEKRIVCSKHTIQKLLHGEDKASEKES